jgi:flagellar basal body rod protein FlgB
MLFSVPSFRFSVGDLSSAVGKWSRVATFGAKSKDGAEMVFDASTLGQMVANSATRGDKIAICQDHLSAYVAQTGQPAPALGYFTALAVVAAGKVVKAWNGQPEASGLPDGLYALLGEVTPRGLDPKDGLANYAFLSPMFTMDGSTEDGRSVGPTLYDVAATNTPFQSGTEIQFHAQTTGAARPTGATKMDDTEMARRFGWEPGDDDTVKLKKAMAKFAADSDDKKDDDDKAKTFDVDPDNWAQNAAVHIKTGATHSEAGSVTKGSKIDGADGNAVALSVQLAAVAASNAALMARLAAVAQVRRALIRAAQHTPHQVQRRRRQPHREQAVEDWP